MNSPEGRVTRADLEDKFRSLQRDVTGVADERKSYVVAGAVGTGILALIVAYVMGRRRGRRSRSGLER
jgi:hypothetical protein